jgi:hypothetical protein
MTASLELIRHDKRPWWNEDVPSCSCEHREGIQRKLPLHPLLTSALDAWRPQRHAPTCFPTAGRNPRYTEFETWWHMRRNQILSFVRNGRVHLNRPVGGVSSVDCWQPRCARISGSNAGYTMIHGSAKGTGYLLHSPVSPSLPLPCVTVCHQVSTGLYPMNRRLDELHGQRESSEIIKQTHIVNVKSLRYLHRVLPTRHKILFLHSRTVASKWCEKINRQTTNFS